MTVKKKKSNRGKKPGGKLEDIQLPKVDKPKVSFMPHGKRSFKDEEELRASILEYFQFKKVEGRPITVAGLCCWFSVTRETLLKYESGIYDDDFNKYSDTIKEAKVFIENDKLEMGLLGVYNSQITKFDLSNNHSYTEKAEIKADVNQNAINVTTDFKDPQKAFESFKKLIKRQ